MREILFRGKRVDNNEWIYGYYHKLDKQDLLDKTYIIPDYASAIYSYEVIPETIGQYTGLKDKSGVKIFEGDIIRTYANYGYGKIKKEVEIISQVIYYVDEEKTTSGLNTNHMSAFKTKQLNKQEYTSVDWSMFFQCEVIGNIHDKEV